MAFVKFGFLVGNEVFHTALFDEDHPVAEKWIAALRSGVQLVDTAEYSKIRKGYFYNNGNFFGPEDESMSNPLSKTTPNYDETIVFAGVIDNEVIGLMSIVASETEPELYEMIKAGMLSDPTYAEVDEEVSAGWVFENGVFINPEG